MLFVILFVGTCIRAMLEAKGKSWAIMLKSYIVQNIHSPTLSFRGIIVHFQIFIQERREEGRAVFEASLTGLGNGFRVQKKIGPSKGKS